ncbi:MAG: hypothetical protein IID18_05040, partial [Nitrospinae bacterium]|nr:hypothetical protein [Nitrospinota bacterium]
VATKLTTVIVLPLLFLGIAWEGQRQKENPLARLAAFVLITLIMLIPWWGRNVWYTGNPLAPYFLQFFGGADRFNWDPERSLLQHLHYSSFGMGRGIVDFLLLPFRLTFSSEPDSLRFDGQIGILFFLLIPAWLGLVKKRNFFPMTVVLTVLMIFWFIHFQYIRLLAPAFAFLAVLSVAGLQSFTSHHSTGVVATPGRSFIRNKLVPAALVCGIVFNLTLVVKEWNRIQPVPYLTRQETRDAFLARNIPAYPLYQSVNRNLGPRDRVLFVYMRNLGYLSDRPFISDTFFEAHTLQTMLKEDASADGLSIQMKAKGITHLLFNNRYVFGSDSAFSPTEKEALKEFLNGRAKLVEGRNGFYLYRFDS